MLTYHTGTPRQTGNLYPSLVGLYYQSPCHRGQGHEGLAGRLAAGLLEWKTFQTQHHLVQTTMIKDFYSVTVTTVELKHGGVGNCL